MYLNSRFLNTSGQSGFNCGLIGAMGGEFRTMGPWQDPYKASVEKVIDETGAPTAIELFPRALLYKRPCSRNDLPFGN